MPEDSEVEAEKLRGEIEEGAAGEARAHRFLRTVAVTTSVLAAAAALAALRAAATVNEAIVLKTEATRLQAEASDEWAFFQAKGIKAAIAKATEATWQAAGKPAPPGVADAAAKLVAEQQEIRAKAEDKQRERDARSAAADALLARHQGYAGAVGLLQVAIAVAAVGALTRLRSVWIASLLLGGCGIALFASQLLR